MQTEFSRASYVTYPSGMGRYSNTRNGLPEKVVQGTNFECYENRLDMIWEDQKLKTDYLINEFKSEIDICFSYLDSMCQTSQIRPGIQFYQARTITKNFSFPYGMEHKNYTRCLKCSIAKQYYGPRVVLSSKPLL